MKSTDRNLHGVSSRILAHAITHSKVSGTFQKRLSGRYRPESVTLSRGVGAPARPPTALRLAGRLARRSHRPLLWITAAWLGLLQVVMVILIYQDILLGSGDAFPEDSLLTYSQFIFMFITLALGSTFL